MPILKGGRDVSSERKVVGTGCRCKVGMRRRDLRGKTRIIMMVSRLGEGKESEETYSCVRY